MRKQVKAVCNSNSNQLQVEYELSAALVIQCCYEFIHGACFYYDLA